MKKVHRRWGWYIVLAKGRGYKVKKLFVKAFKKTSLQRHKLRSEVWVSLAGNLSDMGGETRTIDRHSWHQLHNITSKGVYYIEVQVGVCKERDIERQKDGR